jgi:hypothetical protein
MYTTARRRRCSSVTFPSSLIAPGLHQPRDQPRQPDGDLPLNHDRSVSHTAAATI